MDNDFTVFSASELLEVKRKAWAEGNTAGWNDGYREGQEDAFTAVIRLLLAKPSFALARINNPYEELVRN